MNHTPHTTPAQDLLPDATQMGAVTLAVHDLDAMITYYNSGLGLQVLSQDKGTAQLGHRGATTLILDQDGTLAHAPKTAAGLYHTAFLFPEARDLATVVASAAQKYPHLYQGASDHLVSEAFYFGDPEGNGVELYIDRPREQWQFTPNGQVTMGTQGLNPNQFLRTHLTEAGMTQSIDVPATVGHVHLKVGNIAVAQDFYVNTLGFSTTLEYGTQALFVSAGGYHHHIGMNTWESNGATERTPALGLGEVTIQLPHNDTMSATDALGALNERLTTRGIEHSYDGHELIVHDPWRNRVRVHPAIS